MNLLVTAGNTQAPIDRVRVVTNIFSGRTGAAIAHAAWGRGHRVTLVTSHPENADPPARPDDPDGRFTVVPYSTYDDLAGLMQHHVRAGGYDVIFHSAAVSDFLSAGVYAPAGGTFFNARFNKWEREAGLPPQMVEQTAGKIKSTEPELWLRLARAPKLVDRIRTPWGFSGLLVKFKLEVDLGDQELIDVAERSRTQSGADLMCANTLDGAAHYAFVGPVNGSYERVPRRELADHLVLLAEMLQRGRGGP